MSNVKPYYTTSQLLVSIKNRIGFPFSQNTLTENDVIQMMNEELQINAVPAIKELHEEYFVYKCPPTPLVNGISRYPIPSRAMGMSVRDINWSDTSGNFFKLTRIAPEEKSFFQQNVGSNQAIGKYYLEGNEIVITPQVQTGATGSLNFFIYLRPNYLVKDDRAAVIQEFQNRTTVNNASLNPGDTFTIITGNQTPSPVITTLTAVNNLAKTIVSISTDGIITTTNPHGIPYSGSNKKSFGLTLTGVSGISPDLNGVQVSATAISSNEIKITNVDVDVAGIGGTYSLLNQYEISTTNTLTAVNIKNVINALSLEGVTATNSDGMVIVAYEDISSTFESSSTGLSVDNTYIYVRFDATFQPDYTDLETDKTTALYVQNSKIDFLQTDPGHRTYLYDIKLREVLPNYVGKFKSADLKTYLNNSSGGVQQFSPIKVGDYICLANECIIPQIPPELHSALAERTAARILSAIGDKEGLAISQAKIAELDKQQATLIGQRVDSSVPKVFNQFSLLRLGKRGRRRL